MKNIWARIRQWFTAKLAGSHSTEPRPASGVPKEGSPARKINGNPKTEPATDNPSQPNEDNIPRPQPEPTEIEPPKDPPQEESPPATAPPEPEPQPEPDPQHTPASPEETPPVEKPSTNTPSKSQDEDPTKATPPELKSDPQTTNNTSEREEHPDPHTNQETTTKKQAPDPNTSEDSTVEVPVTGQPPKTQDEDIGESSPHKSQPGATESETPADPNIEMKRDPNKPREKPGKYPGKRGPTPTRKPDPEKQNTKRRFKLRSVLICRESNNGWEILLSIPEELNTVRVLQKDKSLSQVNNEYSLDDFSNPLTIIRDGNKNEELCLTPPMVFKTSEDWSGIGRQVKWVTRGYFVIIAPSQWTCRAETSVDAEECLDVNYLAHYIYCDQATDKDVPIFDECKELYKTEILRLNGATVFDQSKKGTLCVQSPPDLKVSNDIIWGRVGYEERTGGWSKQFEPQQESLAEVLNGREGHFFIRVYDKECRLIDSDQFRYYSNLKEIRLNGVLYKPDHYIFPSESKGHTESTILFIDTNGKNLIPESKDGQGIVDNNGRITIEPDLQLEDKTTWILKPESGEEVEVVLTIPRIWWCLGNDKESGLWYDKPISMSRRQFIDRVKSGTQLFLHPENIGRVHCGFNQDMSRQLNIKAGLPLSDLQDEYEELQTPLLKKIDFSISLNDVIFDVINIVEPPVSLKQLMVAGIHFGHQTRRWNPKMAPYIFGERNGIHIIDLRRTLEEIDRALAFVRDLAAGGGVVLFVGTKKQAQAAVQEAADRAGMPYVNFRWLGGMLTNFKTINQRIFYMKELAAMEESGDIDRLPKKERLRLRREFAHLERTLGGVAEMDRPPAAVFVIDLNAEHIAVREAVRLGIPVIALVDTNCNPNDIDFVIPGNDDAIRAASLIANAVSDACLEGTRSSRKLTPSGHPPP